MTWADFYLICFAVGFSFSFLAFFTGGMRWQLHLPHFPHAHGGSARVASATSHGQTAGAGTHPASHSGQAAALHGHHISPFNFVTLTAFLAWFGGTGYLLTRYSSVWVGFGLALALGGGLLGGGVVFVFLTKVLMSREENMDPADYEMTGVLAKICSSVRAGGTGEIIYSQAGTRRTCGARAEDGSAIGKGTEVVVTRYEKGIAYVRLWSEMSGDQ
jgi:membrane protein implicated in regulation of membrane protease activity